MKKIGNVLNYNTMKKLCILALLLVGIVGSSFAQNARLQEKIKSMRIALFTERLQLTPEEAQQFWPLFNQYEADKKKLRTSYNLPASMDNLTDAQADEAILASLEIEEKEVGLKRKSYGKLKSVLSAQKIAKLQKAEREFKERILEIINEPRKQKRKNRKKGFN